MYEERYFLGLKKGSDISKWLNKTLRTEHDSCTNQIRGLLLAHMRKYVNKGQREIVYNTYGFVNSIVGGRVYSIHRIRVAGMASSFVPKYQDVGKIYVSLDQLRGMKWITQEEYDMFNSEDLELIQLAAELLKGTIKKKYNAASITICKRNKSKPKNYGNRR